MYGNPIITRKLYTKLYKICRHVSIFDAKTIKNMKEKKQLNI